MVEVSVKPNKNLFLLYTFLNNFNSSEENQDTHWLRRKTFDYFKKFKFENLNINFDFRTILYMFTLNEAPDFSLKKDLVANREVRNAIEVSQIILPIIKKFYNGTFFENFYRKILKSYKEECIFIEGIIKRYKIVEALLWVFDKTFPEYVEIIPMPLENKYSSKILDLKEGGCIIIGPPFDINIIYPLIRKLCNFPVKKIFKSISYEIDKRRELFSKISSKYKTWEELFEEYFIRTIQLAYILPLLEVNIDIEKQLQDEEKDMPLIRLFYKIAKNEEKINGSLSYLAIKLLEELDKFYKAI